MRKEGSVIPLFLFIFLFSPALIEAETVYQTEREREIDRTLDRAQSDIPNSINQRQEVIEKTFRWLELTLEFGFATQGEQIFEVVDSQERRISRLDYPHRGEMLIFKGEVGVLPRLSIGGRYGSSFFKKRTAIDQDWDPDISEEAVWLESESKCKSEVEFWDLNIYYCLLDLSQEEIEQERLFSKEDTIFDYLLIDRLSLDIFAGYQRNKGRYPMTDGVWTVYNYTPTSSPISGLDSLYKIRYKGPRLGMRAEGSKGKVTTRLSVAYAWLETKAYGWWNLREYSFWQSGKNGFGVDIVTEITYAFNPSFSVGLGFNYLYLRQKKLKESGVMEIPVHYEYYNEDIIRNADSRIYGPSFILKYIW